MTQSQPKPKRTLPKGMIPMNQRPKEEQDALRKKAVEARLKKAAERKKMKENLELLLSLRLHNRSLKASLREMGIENPDNQMGIMLNMINQALKDNKESVAAATFVRDTSDQKPKDTLVNVQTDFESYIQKLESDEEF